jgi:hypothetical protein
MDSRNAAKILSGERHGQGPDEIDQGKEKAEG